MAAPTPAFVSRQVGRRVETVSLAERNVKVGGRDLKVAAPTGQAREV